MEQVCNIEEIRLDHELLINVGTLNVMGGPPVYQCPVCLKWQRTTVIEATGKVKYPYFSNTMEFEADGREFNGRCPDCHYAIFASEEEVMGVLGTPE